MIVSLDEEACEVLEGQGWDYHAVLDRTEKVLSDCGIRVGDEEPFTAWVTSEGEVLGTLWASEKEGFCEGSSVFRFTVVVAEKARRQGIARELVQDLESKAGHAMLEAWVVNPSMAKLLEGLDFDGNWSLNDPMMEKYL